MTLSLYGGARSRASMPRWYLEEKGIPYTWVEIDLQVGENRQEAYLAINPFGKLPALVDDSFRGRDGAPLKLFESGAILLHLAEHHGREFEGPQGAARRSLTSQWLLFANSTLATALFVPSSREREFPRLMTSLDALLAAGGSLLAGGGFDPEEGAPSWTAADCAVQAYLAYLPVFFPEIDLTPFPHVRAVIEAAKASPAYWRGIGRA
jgi:glutathione S-transferase